MEPEEEETKRYTWTQTEESLTISIPMKNVAVSKVDVSLTDVYMKVNVPQNKLVLVFDLLHPIMHLSPKNRIQMRHDCLELFLLKEKTGIWAQLLHVDSKEALKKRREDALAREKKDAEERAKVVAKRKIELDKHTVNEQIALEEAQRQAIRTRKEEEKAKAEQEVYATLEQIDRPRIESTSTTLVYPATHPQLEAVSQAAVKSESSRPLIQELVPVPSPSRLPRTGPDARPSAGVDSGESKAELVTDTKQPHQAGPQRAEQKREKAGQQDSKDSIFTESDVREYEKEAREAPKIREKATIKLGFTERKYPNLAARETYLKEPPLPKAAQIATKDNEGLAFEEKNPLWLKEKGDNFFANNDFVSALNAYNRAIEASNDFLKCYINRATCYLKMRAYKNCLEDCQRVEALLAKQKKEEDPEFFGKVRVRALIKQAAVLCWLNRLPESLALYEQVLSEKQWLSESELQTLERDRQKVKRRQDSLQLKSEGDMLLKEAKLPEAIQKYEEGLQLDNENEYLYANLSLAYLKLANYERCLEHCEKALQLLRSFQKDSHSYEREHKLEVKLLLRRARSYDALKDYRKAKADLDVCVMYEPENAEAAALLRNVQRNLNKILVEEAKLAGQKLQTERKFAEALEKYEDCLKITKRESTLENISIYANAAACLLSLGLYERVLQNCELALRMASALRNKLQSAEPLEGAVEKLRQLEIRLYMRRAHAYAKLQQIGQAIEAAQKALELDPDNENIKADLKLLQGTPAPPPS